MEANSYATEKLEYYRSEHFRETYKDKWVAIVKWKPNHVLPQFVSRTLGGTINIYTVYVNKAILFPNKDATQQFIDSSGDQLIEPCPLYKLSAV
jgi:hypothetical protein